MRRNVGSLATLGVLLVATGCTSPVSVRSHDDRPEPAPRSPVAIRPAPQASAAPIRPIRGATRTPSRQPIVSSASTGSNISRLRFVVDAGHGGKDPGARGRSPVPEKEITLAMAREVAMRLVSRGAKVSMTRSSDKFVELEDRAALADRTGAALLISLHADSAERESAAGVGVWVARGALPGSKNVARSILAEVKRAGLQTRSMQEAGFKVLVGHDKPSVLVECGFLTNSTDAKMLNTREYRKKLADAIVAGIVRTLGS